MIRKCLVSIATLALLAGPTFAQESTSVEQTESSRPMEGRNLVVYIQSDDTSQAGFGLFTAKQAARAGANVTIVLTADGTRYGLNSGPQETFLPTGQTPRELLNEISDFGGEIIVCWLFSNAFELEADDFVEGARIVSMREIFQAVWAENARILQF